MNVDLPAGQYVVAVSGGVDSMVLLHVLARRPDLRLTVAHFDHGIRADSAADRQLVQAAARHYGLPFVYHQGKLGAYASEAQARDARYQFLHTVRQAAQAQAIITAHHQDDVLETMILNLLRGTGRRGLSSLKNTEVIKRPLLHIPKQEIIAYAKDQGLVWREDSTNADERYMRNYIRARIMPRLKPKDREAMHILHRWADKTNRQISEQVTNYLHLQPQATVLDRHSFIMLPHNVAREVMGEWLLQNTRVELSKKLLERLVVAAKTGRVNSRFDVDRHHWLQIDRTKLALMPRER